MAKITEAQFKAEQERINKRYDWIVNLAEVFDKEIMYKYFEANTNDREYIKELKEQGIFEEKAKRWWRGNMFITMEAGAYNEETFSKDLYIQYKENVELPRIRELRQGSINWVFRSMEKKNPMLLKELDAYGADWSSAEYVANKGGKKTQIVLNSHLGLLVILYDPSTGIFEVQGI